LSGDRDRASLAVSGSGLALCGVGFDLDDLADYRNLSKKHGLDDINPLRPPEHVSNPASRRHKQSWSVKVVKPLGQDTSSSISTYFETRLISDKSWMMIEKELMVCDPLLLFYPERAFSFSFGDVLLSQSSNSVFSTIWDAEVLLAHFCDEHWTELLESNGHLHMRCLELGAGCGLAGLALKRAIGTTCEMIWQEIDDEAVAFTRNSVMNACSDIIPMSFLSFRWGEKVPSSGIVDLVLMADVFYHVEHFEQLLQTIMTTLRQGGMLVFAFEQRRKDLLAVVLTLLEQFENFTLHNYRIPATNYDSKIDLERHVDFYVCSCQLKK
jgi:predicted nicotinamide N-methyase